MVRLRPLLLTGFYAVSSLVRHCLSGSIEDVHKGDLEEFIDVIWKNHSASLLPFLEGLDKEHSKLVQVVVASPKKVRLFENFACSWLSHRKEEKPLLVVGASEGICSRYAMLVSAKNVHCIEVPSMDAGSQDLLFHISMLRVLAAASVLELGFSMLALHPATFFLEDPTQQIDQEFIKAENTHDNDILVMMKPALSLEESIGLDTFFCLGTPGSYAFIQSVKQHLFDIHRGQIGIERCSWGSKDFSTILMTQQGSQWHWGFLPPGQYYAGMGVWNPCGRALSAARLGNSEKLVLVQAPTNGYVFFHTNTASKRNGAQTFTLAQENYFRSLNLWQVTSSGICRNPKTAYSSSAMVTSPFPLENYSISQAISYCQHNRIDATERNSGFQVHLLPSKKLFSDTSPSKYQMHSVNIVAEESFLQFLPSEKSSKGVVEVVLDIAFQAFGTDENYQSLSGNQTYFINMSLAIGLEGQFNLGSLIDGYAWLDQDHNVRPAKKDISQNTTKEWYEDSNKEKSWIAHAVVAWHIHAGPLQPLLELPIAGEVTIEQVSPENRDLFHQYSQEGQFTSLSASERHYLATFYLCKVHTEQGFTSIARKGPFHSYYDNDGPRDEKVATDDEFHFHGFQEQTVFVGGRQGAKKDVDAYEILSNPEIIKEMEDVVYRRGNLAQKIFSSEFFAFPRTMVSILKSTFDEMNRRANQIAGVFVVKSSSQEEAQ